jgi:hypothetical protein
MKSKKSSWKLECDSTFVCVYETGEGKYQNVNSSYGYLWLVRLGMTLISFSLSI